MNKPCLRIDGDGLKHRAGLLTKWLDPRWLVQEEHSQDYAAVTAVIGMPAGSIWNEKFPNLRFLQLPGAGTDGLNPNHVSSDTQVCNVYEHEASIAEYVFATLLKINNSWLDSSQEALKRYQWPHFDRIGGGARPSLAGTSIGFVGYGHIAHRCANVAKALNMHVKAFTRSSENASKPYRKLGCEFFNSLAEMAKSVDYLVIACPLTKQTEGLVNQFIISCMKNSAVLVNVSRAQIVDEKALFDALSSKSIAGAVLDVWYRYPSTKDEIISGSKFPFHELENVLATPHLSANTGDMVARRWRFMAENLNRFLQGQELQNKVIL